MAKEEMYHIALDDYEHGIIIRSLNDEKTDLMNEGKSTDAVFQNEKCNGGYSFPCFR